MRNFIKMMSLELLLRKRIYLPSIRKDLSPLTPRISINSTQINTRIPLSLVFLPGVTAFYLTLIVTCSRYTMEELKSDFLTIDPFSDCLKPKSEGSMKKPRRKLKINSYSSIRLSILICKIRQTRQRTNK